MSDSLVVVNFKTYQTAHGACAEDLARAMASIDTKIRMVAAVSAFAVSYTHLTLPTILLV